MFLIVGLGNPGAEYVGSRHNVGFEVLSVLAENLGARFTEGRGDYLFAPTRIAESEATLILPTTYMNRSGRAVIHAMEEYRVPPDRLLVIVDDFQLPLGSLRIRSGGSDGGHNGLGSIIYELETDRFPRIRCGIGSPEAVAQQLDVVEFVLGRFTSQELPVVRDLVERAAEAVVSCIEDGLYRAMSRFNVRPEQS